MTNRLAVILATERKHAVEALEWAEKNVISAKARLVTFEQHMADQKKLISGIDDWFLANHLDPEHLDDEGEPTLVPAEDIMQTGAPYAGGAPLHHSTERP